MLLSDAAIEQTYQVKQIHGDEVVRIMEMGLTPGSICVVIRGSYGVSMEIKIRGYLLSLRKRNRCGRGSTCMNDSNEVTHKDLLRQPSTIALVGNPNTGKSTIFNALTGLRQKIANYPGITVERKMGTTIINGVLHKMIDLPGAYSLNHRKADERITYETLIGSYDHEEKPDLLLLVVDASNLERNLFLAYRCWIYKFSH